MRRIILVFAAFSMAGCTLHSVGSEAVTAADYIYTSAEQSGEALVAQGLLDKAEFKRDSDNAYSVLLAVRSGKATVDQLIAAVAALKGNPAPAPAPAPAGQ